MIAYFILQALLLAVFFGALWKLFGRRIFNKVTYDEEREVRDQLLAVEEKMAALPEPGTEGFRSGAVENLRAEYERDKRELRARLDRVRGNLRAPALENKETPP